MWVDDDNVLHTVALPTPTDVMTDGFRRGMDSLIFRDRERLRDLVDDAQDRLLKADWSHLERSESFIGVPPPVDLLDGPARTTSDVALALASVDERWRLDVALALEDYLD